MFVFCGSLERRRARETAHRERMHILTLETRDIAEAVATESTIVASEGTVCNSETCHVSNASMGIIWWRKCAHIANRHVTSLLRELQKGLTHEELVDVTGRIIRHDNLQEYLPKCVRALKESENNALAIQSIQGAYQTITIQGGKQSSFMKNVILSAVASQSSLLPQNHIRRALGASKWLVKKAVTIRSLVDGMGECLWGGLPRKRRCDVLDEATVQAVVNWWETSSIVSPNQKDVKRRRIGVKLFDKHPTHYLQESQVHFSNVVTFIQWILGISVSQ